ncbi:baseplate J/gp47 family protein [Neobacillus mesonae]|uniref:Baseplate J protein n=1 Tax=Neobacillus mesonae TaxID=1193713 RepID=A0A3Q9QTL0_9BACI|nr:baseplate J/gp47 family protein [Neobacillus mesonae]AZU61083.1 baseplate J protein [Neobacillus mesonae]
MAFEDETQDVIHERMLDTISDEVDKRQGSVVWDLTAPAAIELAQVYTQLDNVLMFGFASEDTPSDYLEKRTSEIGVTRKDSVKASGALTFTGDNGLLIPAGTRVSTDELEPVYFVTVTDVTIAGGQVTVMAEAELGGANGNVRAGSISIVLGVVSGVANVTNSQAFSGGADAESDESLLARYYEKVRKPATSGNAYHYEQWAKAVPGVGNAKVYPLWSGPGTVKVVLLDDSKKAPTQTIIDAAKTSIEEIRPIGAIVTVAGATETPINVTATLTLAAGKTSADAKTEFTALLSDYLKTLAFVDPIVRYSKIASLLLDVPSVVDYANLTVNNGTANVTIADGAVAVAGTVTFS